MSGWFSRLVGRPERVTGPPTSSNGASSFHLWWRLPEDPPLVEVSAVLEVVTSPQVEKLYFWALQAGFADAGTRHGAGHLGLQWNPSHPGHGAVNWGGYHTGGAMLDGSASALPSARAGHNTRDYPWQPGRRYRLRIHPSGQPGAWRGEVTDMAAGEATVVRDLYGGGDRLVGPVMWSEVFADCDAPSVTARWSELAAVNAAGTVVSPEALRVNYQSYARGGCGNTTMLAGEGEVLQVTSTERVVPQDAVLAW